MLGHQGIDDLMQGFAFHDLRQLVQRQINAVIGDAALRKIIGADAFRAVAGADLPAPLGRSLGVELAALGVVQFGAQHLQRFGFVLMLRALFLHKDDHAGRQMGDADGGFGLVDVLAAGALGPHGVDLEIVVFDQDIDVFHLGQHRDRRRGSVDAAGRLGIRHALHPVHAGFEFELGEHTPAVDFGDDFLEAAFAAFADRQDFRLPALLGGIALVHAEQIAGEQRGLVAAGAGADFQDGVVVVHRVFRDQRKLDLMFELIPSRLQRRLLGVRQLAHLGIG